MEIIKYKAEYASEVMQTIPYGYINKTICGCGITTVILENDEDVIIAVPKINLSQNKQEQYPNDRCSYEIFIINGEVEDRDLKEYIKTHKVLKIMVTFHSLYRVEYLLNRCRLIIDESDQMIEVTSSSPKEMEKFYNICLKYKDTVSFVSATPLPTKYLPKWISDINQVTIEWEGTIRTSPIILERTYPYKALKNEVILPIMKKGFVTLGDRTFSKGIIFINSVEQIVKTIKDCNVNKEDCRIVCGDNLKNDLKISGIKRYSVKQGFSKFLFITKTGFNGMDIISRDAMTIVVSNTTKKWQMINVLTDLKQAISRQRDKKNIHYGYYVYIYNQIAFNKTEKELLDELDFVYKNLENGIYNWRLGKEHNREWIGYENDPDFIRYTIKIDGEYVINENLFEADKYFILETRKSYTKGFEIKSSWDDVIEVKPPESIEGLSYTQMVSYFQNNNENGKINWKKIGGKTDLQFLIEECYRLYRTTWKNQTYAKAMVNSYGNPIKVIEVEIKNLFIKNKSYSYQDIKDMLNDLYNKYNIKRVAKVSDLSEVITVKQIRINNKRFMQIL